MLVVRTIDDPGRFLEQAGVWLLRDEARHNLLLGILATLRTHPDEYETSYLWLVEDGGVVAGAALMTPPFSLAMARPRDDDVVAALAAHVAQEHPDLPGVIAAEPEVETFVEAWSGVTGVRPVDRMRQGIYELTDVVALEPTTGTARRAHRDDRSILLPWLGAFMREAFPDRPPDDEGNRRALAARMDRGEEAGLWLWEDEGRPVSMAGFSGPTTNGIRVGPVYTPPADRGRGYATSLVAEMSAHLLAHGFDVCFLYTDLANPTSNAIYRRIGYRHVCDAAHVRFSAAALG